MAWNKIYPESPPAPIELGRFSNHSGEPQIVQPDEPAPLVAAVVFNDANVDSKNRGHSEKDTASRRILLLQRAAHDSAPGCWELPGGSFEPTLDATILQALGRELWEETGLRLRSVRRLVDEVAFQDDHYPGFIWRNATFVVDLDDAAMRTGTAATGRIEDKDDLGGAGSSFPVRIDPQEHQDWGWATEAEIISQSWQKEQWSYSQRRNNSCCRHSPRNVQ